MRAQHGDCNLGSCLYLQRGLPYWSPQPAQVYPPQQHMNLRYLRTSCARPGECRPGTCLDAEALERGTSIYLVDAVIPMLPRLLCEELCSLGPGADHLTFSIIWHLSGVGLPPLSWQALWIPQLSERTVGEAIHKVCDPDKGARHIWGYNG